ncbi:hypothetical protein RJ639_014084 [Escallonia herrerae]|uniref:Cytochrome c domain-containing protein n=1 Tax=Escallonia herrerae TaxID=1293975 RepID=A0AA88VGA7_9ASTE|nr:hypothetical protein RJ639_014084 [Escallonia herrerae]
MDKKERAKERREKRRQEISLLRTIPYSDHQRWWSSDTIAVVTGANRGIGFEIAHQLALHGLTVILTSRETGVGDEAAKVLQEGGLNVVFHQLDVVDPLSIKAFVDWVQQSYGGIDILISRENREECDGFRAVAAAGGGGEDVRELGESGGGGEGGREGGWRRRRGAKEDGRDLVNNAGVNFNLGSENSVEYAEKVILTNYYGTKNMIQAMIPLMRPSASGARIVSVSSRGKAALSQEVIGPKRSMCFTCHLLVSRKEDLEFLCIGQNYSLLPLTERERIGNIALRQQLEDVDQLSEELIDRTVTMFLEQVKDGSWTSGGWPQTSTDYSISKLAVNAYTRLMAKVLSNRPDGHKIYINCYCPGWVKTAMTGWAGNVTPEEGADTAVWLALLPDQFVSGKFFAERREINF